MTLRQLLDARGAVEPRPFSAQRRDGVVLTPDLRAQLGDLLHPLGRFKLDLVDVGSRHKERRNHANVDEADHRRLALMTSASEGSCGSKSSALCWAPRRGGASVRSAARSLADRARGLAAISASSGVTGR